MFENQSYQPQAQPANKQNGFTGILSVSEMKEWYGKINEIGKKILVEDLDYGIINGLDKPVLLKPGAEKLKTAFGLSVDSMECVRENSVLDKNYVEVTYKCVISNREGMKLGICEGSANSRENKFRYYYFATAKTPGKDEAEKLKSAGKGRWKKVKNRWVWFDRVENNNVFGIKNNIEKIAQKRAFVGAVIMATGASEFFTQDADDFARSSFAKKNKSATTEKNPAGTNPAGTNPASKNPAYTNPAGKNEDMHNPFNLLNLSGTQDELNKIYESNTVLHDNKTFNSIYGRKLKEFMDKVNTKPE